MYLLLVSLINILINYYYYYYRNFNFRHVLSKF